MTSLHTCRKLASVATESCITSANRLSVLDPAHSSVVALHSATAGEWRKRRTCASRNLAESSAETGITDARIHRQEAERISTTVAVSKTT